MKKIILFILIIALSPTLTCIASNTFNDSIYIALFSKAEEATSKGDWAEAELYLTDAIHYNESNPANIMLLSNLALIQFQQGKDSIALQSINVAVKIMPNSTTLSNRAKILKAMGRIDEAYADYETIINLDSTLIEPRYMHGLIALSKLDLATAQYDFFKLEQIAPGNNLTIKGKAFFYFYTHQYEKAIPYYNKLIPLDNSAENYCNRATCNLIINNLQDASSDISEAFKLYPNNGELYLLRAWLNRLYYRYDDAKLDAQRAIELGVSEERINAVLQSK